jgi:uncharacterized protein (TIGR03437 family)
VRVGGIAHQNWGRNLHVLDELLTGEIIHVWATGLGAVSPEVAEGSTAPPAELSPGWPSPLTCSNAEVLYAGLAPALWNGCTGRPRGSASRLEINSSDARSQGQDFPF